MFLLKDEQLPTNDLRDSPREVTGWTGLKELKGQNDCLETLESIRRNHLQDTKGHANLLDQSRPCLHQLRQLTQIVFASFKVISKPQLVMTTPFVIPADLGPNVLQGTALRPVAMNEIIVNRIVTKEPRILQKREMSVHIWTNVVDPVPKHTLGTTTDPAVTHALEYL